MLLRQSPATSLLLKQIGVAVVASAVIIASAQAIVGSKSSAGSAVVNGKLLNGTTTVEKAVRPGKSV
jgi:hypothetical protein